MKLALAGIFLILTLLELRRSKIRAGLFFLLFASLYLNIIFFNTLAVDGVENIVHIMLISSFFIVIIYSLFGDFTFRYDFEVLGKGRFDLFKLLILVSIPVLIINCYLVYKVYAYIGLQELSITEYKNTGLATSVLESILPSIVIFAIRLISLLAWFCLFVWIYQLIKGSVVKANYALIASLNIPLVSLMGLSRSGIVYYLFSLLILWFSFRNFVNIEVRRRVQKTGAILFSVLVLILLIITFDRFSEFEYWGKYDGHDNAGGVVLFSIVYYFTSWIDNTLILLQDLTPPLIGEFKGYFSIIYQALSGLGAELFTKGEMWSLYFGDYKSSFVGLFLDTLYDMGVLGYFIFMAILLLSRVYYSRARIRFTSYILLTIYASQYFALFFAGNVFSNFQVSLSLIVTFVMIKLCKTKYFRL